MSIIVAKPPDWIPQMVSEIRCVCTVWIHGQFMSCTCCCGKHGKHGNYLHLHLHLHGCDWVAWTAMSRPSAVSCLSTFLYVRLYVCVYWTPWNASQETCGSIMRKAAWSPNQTLNVSCVSRIHCQVTLPWRYEWNYGTVKALLLQDGPSLKCKRK